LTVSFTARPTAIYKPSSQALERSLTVFELEPRDVGFLEELRASIAHKPELLKERAMHYNIISPALDSIIAGLKARLNSKSNDKSVSLISVFEGKMFSIFQGNVPKFNFDDSKIVRSDRGFQKESEIDYFSNIPSPTKKHPKASAPAIIAEFFNFCLKLQGANKVKSIYCRSEVPEICAQSFAFYKKIGLKELPGGSIKCESPDRPLSMYFLGEDVKYDESLVRPMAIERAGIKKAFHDIASRFNRKELHNAESVDLQSIITTA